MDSRKKGKSDKSFPKDVVIVHHFSKAPHVPSASPFPIKLETWLRMAKIPYENAYGRKMSAKGKIPWIEYNGKEVDDSQLCIEYLKAERGVDMDAHLTAEQKAIARAFQKLTEENLYWALALWRWTQPEGLKSMDALFPMNWFVAMIFKKKVGRTVKNEAIGHGIGRHSWEQICQIAKADMNALSTYLGSKKFLMGKDPSEVDCAIFGMLAQILWEMPGSPMETLINGEYKNLKEYCIRMKDRFWPDWSECISGEDIKDGKQ